jgi:hypothetical protein
LETREKILGKKHLQTIGTRNTLGELYILWGKPEMAKAYLEENNEYIKELNEQQQKHHHHHHDGEECNDPTHKH